MTQTISSSIQAGTPVTIQIGSDFYAGSIISASPSGKTLVVEWTRDGERQTFRLNSCGHYTSKKHYHLADIGRARTVLDPGF